MSREETPAVTVNVVNTVKEQHFFCPWCAHRFAHDETACPVCARQRGFERVLSRKTEQKPKQRWRKVLHDTQPYPDNYVDSTFLDALITNAHVQCWDFKTIVRDVFAVSQQISTVAAFGVVFRYTLTEAISVKFLITIDIVTLVFGYLFRYLTDPSLTREKALLNCQSILLVAAVLYGLSPVLRTLTKTFANDTIWTLSMILTVLHLFFHDYRYINGETDKLIGSVSLNAAIFASVLLASRLPSTIHVFALLFFAIQLFALFPILRHTIRKFSMDLHITLTWLMFGITTALLFPISRVLAVIYFTGLLAITFLCPYWLISIQKYKNEINGPWDIAVPITY